MYDGPTRRELAEALTEAFLQGRWRAEDLAERGSGVLDPRPEWIDGLAFAAVGLDRVTPLHGRDRLQQLIERYLADHPGGPRSDPAPQVLRRLRARRGSPRGDHARGPELRHEWPIAQIESVPALAERLELSDGQLAWLADVRGLERTVESERLRNYRYRWAPRSSGLPRLIEAPKLRLKEVQRWVLREILDHVPPHDAAHGFTRGRSVLSHATPHIGQPAVMSLDLRDFFTSVTAGRVFGIFRTIGYPPPVAHALTGLCTNTIPATVWDIVPAARRPDLMGSRFHLGRALATPHLPQGAPTSPALANLCAFGLDRRLTGLAAALGLRYSRYADDLALSGPGLSGDRSRTLSAQAALIAGQEGFALQPRKSRLRTASRRQLITGVVVNVHPNLARDEYDRLRATLHRLALDGPARGPDHPDRPQADGVDLRAHLNGKVAWAETLNPHRGAKLRRQFDAIDWGEGY